MSNYKGLTLIELLMVIALVLILSSTAYQFQGYALTRTKVVRTTVELNNEWGNTWTSFDPANPRRDPWGNPYSMCYYKIPSTGTPFDLYGYLYSWGPDRMDDYATIQYDPSNGTISNGDIYRVISIQHKE